VVGVARRYPGDINDVGAMWAALSGRGGERGAAEPLGYGRL